MRTVENSFAPLCTSPVCVRMQKIRKKEGGRKGQITSNVSLKLRCNCVFRPLVLISHPILARFTFCLMRATQHCLAIRSVCYMWLLVKLMTNTFVVLQP